MNSMILEVNKTGIFINEYSDNGDAVFFLHPGGSNSYIWHKMISYFTGDYRVLAMDMRGHGQSRISESGYEMENQANDILEVMNQLGIEKAHLVGNSLGTDVAVHFAAMYPERTYSLVNLDAGMLNFIGPHGEVDGDKTYWVQRSLNRKPLEFTSREEFAAFIKENFSYLGEEFVKLTSENIPLRELGNGKFTHMMPSHINAKLMEAWCDMKFENCYPSITCPILFLPADQEDKLEEKLKRIEVFNKYLPWSETHVIPGTTHSSQYSHYQELSDIILDFIKKV